MRKLIKKLLGLDKLEEQNEILIKENLQIKEQNSTLVKNNEYIQEQNFILLKRLQDLELNLRTIKKIIQVGVDVHMKPEIYGRSWAVFCINGNSDYVRFVDMGAGEIREIARFVKQFGIQLRMLYIVV